MLKLGDFKGPSDLIFKVCESPFILRLNYRNQGNIILVFFLKYLSYYLFYKIDE